MRRPVTPKTSITPPSPLASEEFLYEKLDPRAEAQAIASLEAFRKTRDTPAVRGALDEFKRAAGTGERAG